MISAVGQHGMPLTLRILSKPFFEYYVKMTIKTWILTLVDRTTQRGSSFKNYNENVHRSMDCWSWQMLNK